MTPGRVFGVMGLLAVLFVSACTSTANVSDVYMALDGDGARKRNIFFTDSKEIHCVTEVGIGRPGVTLETLVRQVQRYDYLNNVFVDSNRVVAQAENTPSAGDGIQKIDTQLDKPGNNSGESAPYYAGRYVCEVRLDGSLEGTAVFNIIFPPCPTAQIEPMTACVGVYSSFLTCPRYGASSSEPDTCQCTPDLGWRCP
jgi:hypothetical protein